RWAFYRVWDEGYFERKVDEDEKKAKKRAYHNFKLMTIEARKRPNDIGWRPDTLADDTREVVIRGIGHKNEPEWLQALVEHGVECNLDRHYGQKYYVEGWFEARAMRGQFEYYTGGITLRPMGGDPSIPFKYQAAKDLEEAAARYKLPIVVLWFGDCDRKGREIAKIVERDVRYDCEVEFEFVYCGLTLEQVERYGLPEKPDERGKYQWESLADAAAREIIQTAVAEYRDHGRDSDLKRRERAVEQWTQHELSDLVDRWKARRSSKKK